MVVDMVVASWEQGLQLHVRVLESSPQAPRLYTIATTTATYYPTHPCLSDLPDNAKKNPGQWRKVGVTCPAPSANPSIRG